MRAAKVFRMGDSQSQFERHIEPWRRRRRAIEFDAREVVERVAALTNQAIDFFQSPFASRNLDSGARFQAETAQSDDVSDIKGFEFLVVRNIQEGKIVRFVAGSMRSGGGHRAGLSLA